MRAQRELMERELEVERRALERHPEDEAPSSRAMYVRRGIDPVVAEDMVNEVMQDPDLALETHAREELGFPSSIGFAVAGGGVVVRHVRPRRLHSVVAVVDRLRDGRRGGVDRAGRLASIVVGIVLAAFTERSVIPSALRQLAVTVVAAGVTYGVGRAIGTGIS